MEYLRQFTTRIDYGNNFAYNLRDNDYFLHTEYKVLQNQRDGMFIKCMKLMYNGKIQLYYLADNKKSLKEILTVIEPEKFITIILNFIENIIEIKNNGFLSCQNIDISLENIFIDPLTFNVSIVYLPIGNKSNNFIFDFENQIKSFVFNIIQNTESLKKISNTQITEDLSNPVMTLEKIYSRISDTLFSSKIIIPDSHEYEHNSFPYLMKLVVVDMPFQFEIIVNKNEFIIGKREDWVDGVVSFNKLISRTHCKIVFNEDIFSIIDLSSSNGTYLNSVRLRPDQPYTIKDGDIIRLANSKFKAIINKG